MVRTVETYTVVEASVIGLWESYDEFACPLIAGINANTGFGQALRVHHRDKLEKKVRLGFKQIGSFSHDCCLKLLGVLSWDSVPGLCFTPMH